jgi:hypothetical protein
MYYSSYTGEFYDSRYLRDIAEAEAKRAVLFARAALPVTTRRQRPVTVTTEDVTVDAWGVKTVTTTVRVTDEYGRTTTRSSERRERPPVRRYSPPVTDADVAVATGLAVGLGGIALCAALFGGED